MHGASWRCDPTYNNLLPVCILNQGACVSCSYVCVMLSEDPLDGIHTCLCVVCARVWVFQRQHSQTRTLTCIMMQEVSTSLIARATLATRDPPPARASCAPPTRTRMSAAMHRATPVRPTPQHLQVCHVGHVCRHVHQAPAEMFISIPLSREHCDSTQQSQPL